MKSRALRVMVLLLAVAAHAGAGYAIWRIETGAAAERNSADAFDRQARQLVVGLADLRAAFQAYVADGQAPGTWQATAASGLAAVRAAAASLRQAARSPEGQGAVEDAIEQIASLEKTDSRAREYLASGQRLSASDVVFAEAAPTTTRAASAIDIARGHEAIVAAAMLERHRLRQLYVLGAAAVVTLLAVLLLVPVPRPATGGDEAAAPAGEGLGLSHIVPPRVADHPAPRPPVPADAVPAIDLAAAADVCLAMARIQEPRELPAVLERAAAVLGAVGVVVWMPDGPQGSLRPALAHGYSPLAITRMGTLPLDAENATALAFRTRTTQVVPAEGAASGAVAAPLLTLEGCSGVVAAELAKPGPLDQIQAVVTIFAAQLSTLISPSPSAQERPTL